MDDFSVDAPKGDSFDVTMALTDKNGNTLDLDGTEIVFTVKSSIEDTTAVLLKRNLTAGGAVGEMTVVNGTVVVHFLADDMPYDGDYVCSLRVKWTANKLASTWRGTLHLYNHA